MPDSIIAAGPRGEWWDSGGAESGEGGTAPAGGADQAAGDAGASGASGALNAPPGSPSVIGVIPVDDARGVSSDVRVVIAFSQAMDRTSTEAAYRSRDLPATELTFSWDEAQRILTLTPRAPLPYGVDARDHTYRYGFDGSARDRRGQSLPVVEFSFHTLRQLTLELPADSERTGNWTDAHGEGVNNCMRHPLAPYEATVCVGDDLHNVRYWGFLSFDLGQIPEQARQIRSARLWASAVVYGAPELLGENRLEHVVFDALGEAAMNTAPSTLLGPFFSGAGLATGSQVMLNADVSAAVAQDYENRVALQSRSQFKIGFAKGSANSRWDDLELPTTSIHLAISYLAP